MLPGEGSVHRMGKNTAEKRRVKAHGGPPSLTFRDPVSDPETTTHTNKVWKLHKPPVPELNKMMETLEVGPRQSPVLNNTCDFPADHESLIGKGACQEALLGRNHVRPN